MLVLLWAGGAQAKRDQSFRYPFSRVWGSALRMVRVDYSSPITEKDPDSGYFLFEFPDGGKQHAGSVELVRGSQDGTESVRVVISIAALPSYVEQMLLDRLERKLRQEFGDPVEPKQPAEPKQPDAKPDAPGKTPDARKPKAEPRQP